MHVRGSEGFSGQVYDPSLELVMIRCDEAAPLAIEGVANGKFGVAAITVLGRSGGSRPYHRKRASHHSCAPSSFPFTVYSCTIIQVQVFVSRCSQHAPCTGPPTMVAARASSASCALCRQTVIRPSQRQAKWSAVRNSTWHMIGVQDIVSLLHQHQILNAGGLYTFLQRHVIHYLAVDAQLL